MFSQGDGQDDQEDHETPRVSNSYSETSESLAEIGRQLQIQEIAVTEDPESQHLEEEVGNDDNIDRKEGECCSSTGDTLQPERQAETRSADIPVVTNATAVSAREEENARPVTSQRQALHSVYNPIGNPRGNPSQEKLDTATGNQVSSTTDSTSADIRPSTSEPQEDGVPPDVFAYMPYTNVVRYKWKTRNITNAQQTQRILTPHTNASNRNVDTSLSTKQVSCGVSARVNTTGKVVRRQLGLARACSSPVKAHREYRSNRGRTLPLNRQALSPRVKSEAPGTSMPDTRLENTPQAVTGQLQSTEASTKRDKRHYDHNELSTPAAKRQMMVRQRTELQSASSSGTSLPHQINPTMLSIRQEAVAGASGLGAVPVTTGNISSKPLPKVDHRESSSDNVLACDSLSGLGSTVQSNPSWEEFDAMVQSVIEECSKINPAIYSEPKDWRNWVTSAIADSDTFLPHGKDCQMELEESASQTSEDEDEGESDDFDDTNVGAIPRQQQAADEQRVSLPPATPQAVENSGLPAGVAIDDPFFTEQCKMFANDIILLLQTIDNSYTTSVESLTAHIKSALQSQQSQKGNGSGNERL